MNSGGLHLAAAAGIPILRVGEYQALGYPGARAQEGAWGPTYNSFLARDLNVGLGYHGASLEEFDRKVFSTSPAEFYQYVKTGRSPRAQHLLLQPGSAFVRQLLDDVGQLA